MTKGTAKAEAKRIRNNYGFEAWAVPQGGHASPGCLWVVYVSLPGVSGKPHRVAERAWTPPVEAAAAPNRE